MRPGSPMTSFCRTSSPCGWCEPKSQILARPRADRRRAAYDEDPGALPFELTGDQQKAVAEISADLASDKRMLRLLQGDVGSGKTVVALLAMAQAIEAGRQAALMAPTEILARQHFATIKPLAEAAGLTVALITGRDKAAERRATLAESRQRRARHRRRHPRAGAGGFHLPRSRPGGDRRAAPLWRACSALHLARQGRGVDVLAMTATPIPRSLALAYFGDMDLSALREKPPGRQPIDTRTSAPSASTKWSPASGAR